MITIIVLALANNFVLIILEKWWYDWFQVYRKKWMWTELCEACFFFWISILWLLPYGKFSVLWHTIVILKGSGLWKILALKPLIISILATAMLSKLIRKWYI